jgi:hypothetical protein
MLERLARELRLFPEFGAYMVMVRSEGLVERWWG